VRANPTLTVLSDQLTLPDLTRELFMVRRIRMSVSRIVDGSLLEGGGQILRNSIAYSVLLGQKLVVHSIRKGRSRPGLAAQHLAGLQLAAELSNGGELQDARIKSTRIEYIPPSDLSASRPKFPSKTKFTCDTGTAGSTGLIAQVAVPILLFSNSIPIHLKVIGGTNAIKAPPADYSELVLSPMLRSLLGVVVKFSCRKRGFYPKGGGVLDVFVEPCSVLKPFSVLDRGKPKRICVRGVTGGLDFEETHSIELTERSAKLLAECFGADVEIVTDNVHDASSPSSGTALLFSIETSSGCRIAFDVLGKSLRDLDKMPHDCLSGLKKEWDLGGCVDEFMQDQLIIFMALAQGKSEYASSEPSLHTQTAISIAEQLTNAKFNISELGSGLFKVSCDGIGFKNPFMTHVPCSEGVQ